MARWHRVGLMCVLVIGKTSAGGKRPAIEQILRADRLLRAPTLVVARVCQWLDDLYRDVGWLERSNGRSRTKGKSPCIACEQRQFFDFLRLSISNPSRLARVIDATREHGFENVIGGMGSFESDEPVLAALCSIEHLVIRKKTKDVAEIQEKLGQIIARLDEGRDPACTPQEAPAVMAAGVTKHVTRAKRRVTFAEDTQPEREKPPPKRRRRHT